MKRIVHFFIDNPIAANLLMLAVFLGGVIGLNTINKEVFPAQEQNFISLAMNYPGAGPQEVEQQIVVRIEEAIADLRGIFQITSEAQQGFGRVQVEVIEGYDVKVLLNEIKTRVDAISSFPENVELPVIRQEHFRPQLMYFSLFGDVEEATLKQLGQQISDEMSLLDGVSQVTLSGTKPDEVSIEISEDSLRKYRLSFDQIAHAIRQSSMNLPAGTIKTRTGSVQVQTRNQAYAAEDFAQIVVYGNSDGTQLLLGDIALIRDGYTDQDLEVTYNGIRALDFTVHISDNPDLFGGTTAAREYIKNFQKLLPPGVELKINYEMRELFDSRLQLLTSNAAGGLLLVFIILMLFLRPMLGLWVCAGIATAFAGAFWALPYVGISINMLSMFAFLMVLGIVVDDAIVVGESIYARQQAGVKGNEAALEGTMRVLKPVVLAVLSTIIFFSPMLDVPKAVEPYTLSIFYVVAFCLLFSLVECLLILPSHLAHLQPERSSRYAMVNNIRQFRQAFSKAMVRFAVNQYRPALAKMLQHKDATIVSFVLLFFLSLSIYFGGWLKTTFFPNVPQSFLQVNVTLPEGTAYDETLRIARRIEQVAIAMRDDEFLSRQNDGRPFLTEIKNNTRSTNIGLFVGLVQPEVRSLSAQQISNRLKELIGPIPEAKYFSLVSGFGGDTADIHLNMHIADNDYESQLQAVNAVTEVLAAYPGVENVRSSLESERIEVLLSLKEHASNLGITLGDIAKQVRQGLYGEEVQRIPRAKEDVKVMLHYPREERRSLDSLNHMWIRTTEGNEVPLLAVADIEIVPGFSNIERVSRRRNITISADVVDGVDAYEIYRQMHDRHFLQWQKSFPGFHLSTDGNLKAQAQFGDSLGLNFGMAVLLVYALMAVAFRSYVQPLLILTAVPFGFMGAVIGHLLLGHDISMMSFFGFLACAGVVVNDNLVLLDRINHFRSQGISALDAALEAGQDRFRPIMLTSLTTFIGLLPILFEQSSQAQFLIPMVISLSFGVLFASSVTLILVPCIYVAVQEWVVNRRFSILKMTAMS